MNILFYYPSNKRTIAIESLLIALRDRGFNILFLTTCEQGDLHEELQKNGFQVFSNPIKSAGIQFYLAQLIFLVKFIKKHKIRLVLPNLQQVNIIAVFANIFSSARFIIFRHHFDYSFSKELRPSFNQRLGDIIINLLASRQIVPSSGVYNGMKKYEKVNMDRIQILPYIYNFDKYPKPNSNDLNLLKKRYPAKLRILICSRLVPLKRHIIAFEAIKNLIQNYNLDIVTLVLDDGPEKENLQKFISKNQLESNIHMIGRTNKVMDYMAVCDIMLHPSLTDASNSAIKEFSLNKGVVITCEGVGDFSDYIKNEENGFLIPQSNPQKEIESIILKCYKNSVIYEEMGTKLKKDIIDKFGVNESTLNQYVKTLQLNELE